MESCDLNDVMREIGEMKGTLNQFVENTNKIIEKHDTAITSLNTYKDQLIGKQTVVGAVAGIVFGFIGSLMQGGFFNK